MEKIPKGITVDVFDDKIVITTLKKDPEYTDYVVLLIHLLWISMLIIIAVFMLRTGGFLFIPYILLAATPFLGNNILNSFSEIQIITITKSTVYISKKRKLFLSYTEKLDRKNIKCVCLDEIKSFKSHKYSFTVSLMSFFTFGSYRVPVISYKSDIITFLEHYNKQIRYWVVGFMNEHLVNHQV